MPTDETYNGYANRETWSFVLNVTNDQGLAERARERVLCADAHPEDALEDLAESLFTRAGYGYEYGDTWPDSLADIASDIGSLWRVNWAECVDALINE